MGYVRFFTNERRTMNINVVRLEVVKERSVEYGRRKIRSAEDLAELGQKLIGKADREVFLVVCLNAQNGINAINVVSIGSLTASIVCPREVFKLAVVSNSASIALMHNHPSGNVKPSKEDIEITKLLIEAGKILEIDVLDHVIISEGNHYSFLDKGICTFS